MKISFLISQYSNFAQKIDSLFLIEDKVASMTFSNSRYATKDVSVSKTGYKCLGIIGCGCSDAVNNTMSAFTFNYTNQSISLVMLRMDRQNYSGNINCNYELLYKKN